MTTIVEQIDAQPKGRAVKGQLISKCLFGVFNSSKKQTKQFNLRYHSSKVLCLEELKKKFWN